MSRIIVIDTETTGVCASRDELLQVSVISGEGEVLFNEYVRPERHTSWPYAERVNHISWDMVKDKPPVTAFVPQLQKIFDEAEIVVGYNHTFDLRFLADIGVYSDKRKNYDVMKAFAPVYGDWNEEKRQYRWQKLTKCAEFFGYNWGDDAAHDSLADCRATLYCYNMLNKE